MKILSILALILSCFASYGKGTLTLAKRGLAQAKQELAQARREVEKARRDAKSETNIDLRKAKAALETKEAMWGLRVAQLALVKLNATEFEDEIELRLAVRKGQFRVAQLALREARVAGKSEEELEPLKRAVRDGQLLMDNMQEVIRLRYERNTEAIGKNECALCDDIASLSLVDVGRNEDTTPQIATEIGTPRRKSSRGGRSAGLR